jgi:hypothetical protein
MMKSAGAPQKEKGKDPEKPETAIFVRVKGPCGLCGVGVTTRLGKKRKEKKRKREKREKTRDDDDVPSRTQKEHPKNDQTTRSSIQTHKTRRQQHLATRFALVGAPLALYTHHLPSPISQLPTAPVRPFSLAIPEFPICSESGNAVSSRACASEHVTPQR